MSQNENTTRSEIILTPARALAPSAGDTLTLIGRLANHHAQRGTFADYLSRKADNTLRAHGASLARFADYLSAAGYDAGDLQNDPDAWQGVTWGLVEGFRNWMLGQGDAIASINARLSTVKTYAALATKAGVIWPEELAMIRMVSGYPHKEGRRLDERRPVTRRGAKKAQHVSLSVEQAQQLKRQPDTPQGRRDALLMCLLLDHGLRVGEVAILKVSDFDLKAGELRFYRPKVGKEQTHKLTADTLRAVRAFLDSGDAPIMADAPILRSSRKGGHLTDAGMTEHSISHRVRTLGRAIGVEGLSAHDCRHFWATFWARKVDVLRLQEAGGWASLAMPRRYVEDAAIANEGMA